MPRSPIDMTGHRCGQLTVLHRVPSGQRAAVWLCRCDCGKELEIRGGNLRREHGDKSCGCQRGGKVTHGHATGYRTPTYNSWRSMLDRCLRPSHKDYDRYSKIEICDRWQASFQHFLDDMGERPDGMTLDRIDNDGNYEPGNCRWADWATQRTNR